MQATNHQLFSTFSFSLPRFKTKPADIKCVCELQGGNAPVNNTPHQNRMMIHTSKLILSSIKFVCFHGDCFLSATHIRCHNLVFFLLHFPFCCLKQNKTKNNFKVSRNSTHLWIKEDALITQRDESTLDIRGLMKLTGSFSFTQRKHCAHTKKS